MTTNTDGGSAFPHEQGLLNPGMTLRDYFAAKICAAMMTTTSADRDYPNLGYQQEADGPTAAQHIASISYQMADAMLAARESKS